MPPTKLLLVRHGETDENKNLVFQGQDGRGLNARGRDQAASPRASSAPGSAPPRW
jgi:probable phosphoglycerate mutase